MKTNIHFNIISLISSWNEKCSRQKSKKSKRFMISTLFFFENRVAYEIIWKNIAKPGTAQITIKYGACALHAANLRLSTHTQIM